MDKKRFLSFCGKSRSNDHKIFTYNKQLMQIFLQSSLFDNPFCTSAGNEAPKQAVFLC